MRERFHREAKLASSLPHENICSVIDFGEDPRFGLFMVMELLEGVRLDYKIQRDGRLPPKVACDVIGQVAEALRYVHSCGIIHGDIKSENILLTRAQDRRRLAKLLDFGLARPDDGNEAHIEGTPEYLAPERISRRPASPQSDIYALGILFWECLVGELPFQRPARARVPAAAAHSAAAAVEPARPAARAAGRSHRRARHRQAPGGPAPGHVQPSSTS